MSCEKMNMFVAILYCHLNGSFQEWMKYCNKDFCFTICNSALKLFEKNCSIQDFNQENVFYYNYLKSFIIWYEELRCQTNKINILKKKFELFSNINKNSLCNDQTKQNMIIQFSKLQKSYMALNRFAYLWKYKRAHTSVTTDLYFNDIDTTRDSSFVLYQNNTKFTFRISELMRIISGALCNNFEDNFDVKSEEPKNPYNKIEFKTHDLYNIYFHIAFNTRMNMPTLLQLWFKLNFDYQKMCIKNYVFIQETCVKNFVNTINLSNKNVFNDISKKIIPNNEYTKKWTFDENFPSEEIVKKLKPCLYDFYIANNFDCEVEEQKLHINNMSRILKNIYLEDPTFGTFKKKLTFESSFRFDMKNENHAPFIFGANNSTQVISSNKKANKRKNQYKKYKYNRTNKHNNTKNEQKNIEFKNRRSAFYKENLSKDDNSLSSKNDDIIKEMINSRRRGITVNDSIQMGFVNNGIPLDLEYKSAEKPKINWLRILFPSLIQKNELLRSLRQEDKEEIIQSIATLFVEN